MIAGVAEDCVAGFTSLVGDGDWFRNFLPVAGPGECHFGVSPVNY